MKFSKKNEKIILEAKLELSNAIIKVCFNCVGINTKTILEHFDISGKISTEESQTKAVNIQDYIFIRNLQKKQGGKI